MNTASPSETRAGKPYTTKQMGDAGEMLVAAELTLHGVPSYIVPSMWPGYDVVAQLTEEGLQRVSVKTRSFMKSSNFVGFEWPSSFDWLAIVILPAATMPLRRIFIVPKDVAEERSYVAAHRGGRGFFVNRLIHRPPEKRVGDVPTGGWGLADYENNFRLQRTPLT